MMDTKSDENIQTNANKLPVVNKNKRKHQNQLLNQLKKQRLDDSASLNLVNFTETQYYFENGLRKVYPYSHTFTTYCKGRWVGRPLIQVFSAEFRANSKEEYEKFIKAGSLTVNGEKVEPGYILRDNDFVANVKHRHEFPVLGAPVKIVHKSEHIVVVDKPPSIPVHTCGKYRHNSLMNILAREQGLSSLYIVHRLDRLTSGLMIFTTSSHKARSLIDQIALRQVRKEYLCRVEGDFPGETLTCEEPMDTLCHKMGVCCVTPTGKQASTQFQKLSFNGKSSVVLCKPKTGRMHQIRVHLQYLGHPILNDPIYNSDVFGPEKGKKGNYGKPNEKLIEDLLKLQTRERWLNLTTTEEDPDAEVFKACLSVYTNSSPEFQQLMESNPLRPHLMTSELECVECEQPTLDPRPRDLFMFLHALRYQGEDWSYETEIPIWAKDSWTLC